MTKPPPDIRVWAFVRFCCLPETTDAGAHSDSGAHWDGIEHMDHAEMTDIPT